ncbi:MFS general substrate transporter [Daedalea quercina L-15889]|uniref:MFS general substrate transporter n=1 Tax=Daedalea quercina L-15889 TaxID=1314783 RepID=A0A165N284_9APHY|nr:MFS general substrate transporter [Daedalea quercina L-15889]
MAISQDVELKVDADLSESSQQLPSPVMEKGVEAPAPVMDGGLRAWLSVLGGWMIMFSTFGYSSSFGVYQDYYTLQGSSTSSNISWIGSIQIFLSFFMGLPAGLLLDKGYFRPMIIFASLLFVFSMFMLSLANPHHYYELVLSQGVGLGLASGLLLVPAQSVQAHHWRHRRALAMGIVATGSGFGGIIYPIMLNQLIHSRVGFAWGVRATAFLTLGLLATACCIMTTQLPRRERPKVSILRILKDRAYVLLSVGCFLVLWAIYYPFFYMQLWVNLHGLSSTLAFYTLAIMNASSIPGRVVLNLLAVRLGMFNVLGPVVLVMGALVFAMFGVTSTGAVVVFAILYGFFSGAFFSLVVPTIAGLANNVDEVGVLLGLSYCITSFTLLTGTPIDGALLGSAEHAQWYRPTVFSGVTLTAGALSIFASALVLSKRRGTRRV